MYERTPAPLNFFFFFSACPPLDELISFLRYVQEHCQHTRGIAANSGRANERGGRSWEKTTRGNFLKEGLAGGGEGFKTRALVGGWAIDSI